MIAYAAQPNRTASDGAEDHGTYTAAILRNLEAPISVMDMFQKVLDVRTGSTFSFASVPARHETEALRTIAAALGLVESTVWQTKVERDGAGRITAIDLSGLGLSGEIPRAIGTLLHLERLDLSGNDLVGGVPAELGTLAQLKTIDLSENWSCPAMTDTFPLGPTKEVSHGGKKTRAVSARVQVARELRETQPCGLKRTCSARAAEALRASPASSLRRARSLPLSTVGGEREESISDTINPKN